MRLEYAGKSSEADILRRPCVAVLPQAPASQNLLVHGESADVLRGLLAQGMAGKVDLAYLDPPFANGRRFRMGAGRASSLSLRKTDALAYADTLRGPAYAEFLRERFILVRELLAPHGCLYVHADCKVSHVVRLLLDEVFGAKNYRNDIARVKCNPQNFTHGRGYGNVRDSLLFYTKGPRFLWNDPREPLDPEYLERDYTRRDAQGRRFTTAPLHAPGEAGAGDTAQPWRGISPPIGRHWQWPRAELDRLEAEGRIAWSANGQPRLILYADEAAARGKRVQDVWDAKDPRSPLYPTQKSASMLGTIIAASSNPGSVVLDCFSGSGATLLAAQSAGRRWIGVDQSIAAITTIEERLREAGGGEAGVVPYARLTTTPAPPACQVAPGRWPDKGRSKAGGDTVSPGGQASSAMATGSPRLVKCDGRILVDVIRLRQDLPEDYVEMAKKMGFKRLGPAGQMQRRQIPLTRLQWSRNLQELSGQIEYLELVVDLFPPPGLMFDSKKALELLCATGSLYPANPDQPETCVTRYAWRRRTAEHAKRQAAKREEGISNRGFYSESRAELAVYHKAVTVAVKQAKHDAVAGDAFREFLDPKFYHGLRGALRIEVRLHEGEELDAFLLAAREMPRSIFKTVPFLWTWAKDRFGVSEPAWPSIRAQNSRSSTVTQIGVLGWVLPNEEPRYSTALKAEVDPRMLTAVKDVPWERYLAENKDAKIAWDYGCNAPTTSCEGHSGMAPPSPQSHEAPAPRKGRSKQEIEAYRRKALMKNRQKRLQSRPPSTPD